jgi:HKD family nuclease
MLFQPFEDDLSLYRVLELALADGRFSSLTVVVAWAKESGLRRIRPLLSAFRDGGGTTRIILGIDEGGASVEGLRNAISDFDEATVLHDASGTFHPKLYIIDGETASVIVIGSSNLTRGGLFANYEAGVCLDLDLTQEADALVRETVTRYVQRLLEDKTSRPLTEDLIQKLLDDTRYDISTEAKPRHKAIIPDQPDGSPLPFGASLFAKHKDPAPGVVGTSQQPGGSVGDGSAAAEANVPNQSAKTPAWADKRGEAAWRHKEFIDEHGSMTRADSLAIRREIYGPGPGVQRSVTLFGKKSSNSTLWMDHQEDGRTRDEDPVGLTDEGTHIAELWQASQTAADTSA